MFCTGRNEHAAPGTRATNVRC